MMNRSTLAAFTIVSSIALHASVAAGDVRPGGSPLGRPAGGSPAHAAAADGRQASISSFGAHPDDCDSRASGAAAKYAALGHRMRFVAVTNGDTGHQTEGGGALAARRRAEAQEAGRRIGIDYVARQSRRRAPADPRHP